MCYNGVVPKDGTTPRRYAPIYLVKRQGKGNNMYYKTDFDIDTFQFWCGAKSRMDYGTRPTTTRR